ncbi:MAG: serine/threonine protein kinase [Planctomycetota bacterium]|jgi:serine/threonine protein kinase
MKSAGVPPDHRTLQTGVTVGSYRVTALIEDRGRTTTYQAEHLVFGRDVALRFTRWSLEQPEIFRAWLRLIGSIQHPGIVGLIDCGEHEGQPFTIFPLIRGKSLRSLVRSDATPDLLTTLRLFRSVADAVGAMHAADCAHRALRPSKILIDPLGRPLIGGLEYASPMRPEASAIGRQHPSAACVAPENWLGQDEAPAMNHLARGDVWCLGLCLLEALTGVAPIADVTDHEAVRLWASSETAVDLAGLDPQCPTPVRTLIRRSLAKDPAKRYSDGLALERALSRLIDYLERKTGGLGSASPKAGTHILLYSDPIREEDGGRYLEIDVHQKIGSGSFADVFHVKETSFGTTQKLDMALKVLKPELLSDTAVLERFRRESRSVARVQHPNIVQVRGFGRLGASFFIAMDLVRGTTLDVWSASQGDAESGIKRSLSDVLQLVRDLATGLEAMHQHGLVHRDLKPQNVLIEDETSSPVIADFGLIHDAARSRMTVEGRFFGTLSYAPPEQILGKEPSTASDLFALGVIIYELLCGRLPRGADRKGGNSGLQHFIECHPVPLSKFRADLKGPLEDLVMRLLEAEPEARPASATEVIRTLDAIRRDA